MKLFHYTDSSSAIAAMAGVPSHMTSSAAPYSHMHMSQLNPVKIISYITYIAYIM
jgi:hypothetical protein